MADTDLTGKQRRRLRALGHHLRPVAIVGREGVTHAVCDAVAAALEAGGLVKVKVGQGCEADRREVARRVAELTGARLVQVLGRTFLLYRPGERDVLGPGGEPED